MSVESMQLGLRDNKTAYSPGEMITGAAHWEFAKVPKSAEVRLCWFTRGKGTEDVKVVSTFSFESPKSGDVRTFSFEAPAEPYSFSGRLISIIWCVELVIHPGKRFQRAEITIGPEAREIVLLGGGEPN